MRLLLLGFVVLALAGAAIFLYVRSKPVKDGGEEIKAPSFQEKITEKAERIAAQNIVHKFMEARMEKDTQRALQYLTERAIASLEHSEQSRFVLIDNFERYEITDIQEQEGGQFQFFVKVFEGQVFFVEELRVIRVLDSYFIDSIELAG